MKRFPLVLLLVILSLGSCNTLAQVQVSGLVDLVARNANEEDRTNLTFRKESPFHTMRARLFFDAPLDDNNAAFVQLMMDDYQINLYGAYIRLANLAGPYLNLHLGLIPNTLGTWGPRTYSDKNPLIGTPLLWVHHSSFVPGADSPPTTVDELVALKSSRSHYGLPVMYDNCWNTGAELFGSAGPIDYSVGLLNGSVSKPTITQRKNIPQATARLAYVFGPQLIIGLNGYAGPYLWDDLFQVPLPDGKNSEDYLNYGGGCDLAFSQGYLEVHSEIFYSVWEHPFLPDLKAAAGYAEVKYKFLPGWYGAGRVGFFEPGKLTDSAGDEVYWDSPVRRFEFGVGYHPSRRMTVKAVSQLNRFKEVRELDTDHFAIQLSVLL